MKAIFNLCCAMTFTCMLMFAANSFQSSAAAEAAPAPQSRAVGFSSHARSKVVQYFDTYRSDPLGLPPACASKLKAKVVPAAWQTSGIARGTMVQESERSALIEAPRELVRVLPAEQPAVRYYLAGSHLVALDPAYKVVDSIQIPTVRLADSQSLELVRHIDRSL
jgi:hypothetical protein